MLRCSFGEGRKGGAHTLEARLIYVGGGIYMGWCTLAHPLELQGPFDHFVKRGATVSISVDGEEHPNLHRGVHWGWCKLGGGIWVAAHSISVNGEEHPELKSPNETALVLNC